MRDKVTRKCPQTTTSEEKCRRAEADSNRGLSVRIRFGSPFSSKATETDVVHKYTDTKELRLGSTEHRLSVSIYIPRSKSLPTETCFTTNRVPDPLLVRGPPGKLRLPQLTQLKSRERICLLFCLLLFLRGWGGAKGGGGHGRKGRNCYSPP